jgi:hypothetical protein
MKLNKWMDLGYHTYCTLFPPMREDEYTALVTDIKENGLAEEIMLIETEADKYQILDGRNRHTACMDADVVPTFTVYAGDDPLKYTISKNVGRRHLQTGQLAALASEIADAVVGQNQHGQQAYTREQAAIIFGTSVKSIQRYRQIAELDEQLAADIASGKRNSLSEALKTAKENAGEAEPVETSTPSLREPTAAEKLIGVDFGTEPQALPDKTEPPTEEDAAANALRLEEATARIASAAATRERDPATKMIMTKEQYEDFTSGYTVRLVTGSVTIDVSPPK